MTLLTIKDDKRLFVLSFFLVFLFSFLTATSEATSQRSKMNVIFLDDGVIGLSAGSELKRNSWTEWEQRLPTFINKLGLIAQFHRATGDNVDNQASLYTLEISSSLSPEQKEGIVTAELYKISESTKRPSIILARSSSGDDQLRIVFQDFQDYPPEHASKFLRVLGEISPPFTERHIADNFGPFKDPPTIIFDPRIIALNIDTRDRQLSQKRWGVLEETYLLPHYVLHMLAAINNKITLESGTFYVESVPEAGAVLALSSIKSVCIGITGINSEQDDLAGRWAKPLFGDKEFSSYIITHEGSQLGKILFKQPDKYSNVVMLPRQFNEKQIESAMNNIFARAKTEGKEGISITLDQNLGLGYLIPGMRKGEMNYTANVADSIINLTTKLVPGSDIKEVVHSAGSGTVLYQKEIDSLSSLVVLSGIYSATAWNDFAKQHSSVRIVLGSGDRDFPHIDIRGYEVVARNNPNVILVNFKSGVGGLPVLKEGQVHSDLAHPSITGRFEVYNKSFKDYYNMIIDSTFGDIVGVAARAGSNNRADMLMDKLGNSLTGIEVLPVASRNQAKIQQTGNIVPKIPNYWTYMDRSFAEASTMATMISHEHRDKVLIVGDANDPRVKLMKSSLPQGTEIKVVPYEGRLNAQIEARKNHADVILGIARSTDTNFVQEKGGILFDKGNYYLLDLSGRVSLLGEKAVASLDASGRSSGTFKEGDETKLAVGISMGGKGKSFVSEIKGDLLIYQPDLFGKETGFLPFGLARFKTFGQETMLNFGSSWTFEPLIMTGKDSLKEPYFSINKEVTLMPLETGNHLNYILEYPNSKEKDIDNSSNSKPIFFMKKESDLQPDFLSNQDGTYSWLLAHGVEVIFNKTGLIQEIRQTGGENVKYIRSENKVVEKRASNNRSLKIEYEQGIPVKATMEGLASVKYEYESKRLVKIKGQDRSFIFKYNDSLELSVLQGDDSIVKMKYSPKGELIQLSAAEKNIVLESVTSKNILRISGAGQKMVEWHFRPNQGISGVTRGNTGIFWTRSSDGRIIQMALGSITSSEDGYQFQPSIIIGAIP